MGADNWGICPKCVRTRTERIRVAESLVAAAYGTVPVDEYHDLEARLDNLRQKAPDYTLREDYEIGVDEAGVFDVRYEGCCEAPDCGFSFKHRHSESALNEGKANA